MSRWLITKFSQAYYQNIHIQVETSALIREGDEYQLIGVLRD